MRRPFESVTCMSEMFSSKISDIVPKVWEEQLAPEGFDSSHGAFGQLFLKSQPWGQVFPSHPEVMPPLWPAECPSPVTVGVAKVSFCAIAAPLGRLPWGDRVGSFPWPSQGRECSPKRIARVLQALQFWAGQPFHPSSSFIPAPLPHTCLWHARVSSLTHYLF